MNDDELKLLVEATCEVCLESLSPSLFLLVINWHVWGHETYLVNRQTRGSISFTDEEDELIKQLYASPLSPEDIVKKFPDRTWTAIKNRACKKRASAGDTSRRSRQGEVTDRRIWKYSQEEIAILEKYGLKEVNGYVNVTKNTPPSP
jgi:hypothetical protein